MSAYTEAAPSRAEVDALPGATVIEFGTNWCGYCSAAQPHISKALAAHPGQVKLWPTLIFMKDGAEVARVVRPGSAAVVSEAAAKINS